MAIYCISYDLIDKKNYPRLHDKIRSYKTYAHAHDSLWFIQSSEQASDIRDGLKEYTDKDDKLLVIRVILPWASTNLSKEVSDWLKRRF